MQNFGFSNQMTTSMPNFNCFQNARTESPDMGLKFSKSNPDFVRNNVFFPNGNQQNLKPQKPMYINTNQNLYHSPSNPFMNQNANIDPSNFSPSYPKISLPTPTFNNKEEITYNSPYYANNQPNNFSYNNQNMIRKCSFSSSNSGNMSYAVPNQRRSFPMMEDNHISNNINIFNTLKSKVNVNSNCNYNKYNIGLGSPMIIPTQQNNENTEILKINIKIANENKIFSLNRFDDVMNAARIFCENNKLEEKFIKPIVTKIHSALNSIYNTYNSNIEEMSQEYLNSLYILWQKIKDRTEDKQEVLQNENECEDWLDNITSISNISLYDEEENDDKYFQLNNSF